MGLKYDDYLYHRDTLEAGAPHAPSSTYTPPRSGGGVPAGTGQCLGGRNYALDGKGMVALTDMTNFADALKEGHHHGTIASSRGYPGDLYSQRRPATKAVGFDGAGSVTVLAVTTHAWGRCDPPRTG